MTMKPVRADDLNELTLCLANIETLLYAIAAVGASTFNDETKMLQQCDALAGIAERYVDDAKEILRKI